MHKRNEKHFKKKENISLQLAIVSVVYAKGNYKREQKIKNLKVYKVQELQKAKAR